MNRLDWIFVAAIVVLLILMAWLTVSWPADDDASTGLEERLNAIERTLDELLVIESGRDQAAPRPPVKRVKPPRRVQRTPPPSHPAPEPLDPLPRLDPLALPDAVDPPPVRPGWTWEEREFWHHFRALADD